MLRVFDGYKISKLNWFDYLQYTHLYITIFRNLLQKLVPKIGVRADYSLLQMAALVTKMVSWGQVKAALVRLTEWIAMTWAGLGWGHMP